jgi:predicted nucleotidyltransferase
MARRDDLQRLLDRAEGDQRVLAVLLFGSVARGDDTHASDVDICLVASSAVESSTSRSDLQLEYAGSFDFDIAVYQRLPLYLRHRVLAEGRVLFVREEDRLYELALRTVQEFEDYRPLYEAYLEEVARGRP